MNLLHDDVGKVIQMGVQIPPSPYKKKEVNKMKLNIRSREMRIWIDKDDVVNWQGKNLKPSEIIMMGAVLTEHGLNMMGTQEKTK